MRTLSRQSQRRLTLRWAARALVAILLALPLAVQAQPDPPIATVKALRVQIDAMAQTLAAFKRTPQLSAARRAQLRTMEESWKQTHDKVVLLEVLCTTQEWKGQPPCQ